MRIFESILAVAIAVSMLAGCGGSKVGIPEGIEAYRYDDAEVGKIEDVFSDVELIPLEFTGEDYPSSIMEFQMTNKHFLIYDNKDKLHVFTKSGQYKACSEEKYGNGPEEFNMMTGFGWNPYNESIQILTLDKIFFYDENFGFKKTVTLPKREDGGWLNCDNIYSLSESEHLLRPSSVGSDKYEILIFDSEKGEVTGSMSYDEDVICGGTMQDQSFFEISEGEIMLTPPAITNFIYRFDPIEKELVAQIYLSPGKNEITKEAVSLHKDDPYVDGQNYLMTCTKDMPLRTMLNSGKIFSIVKRSANMRSFYTVAIDRKSKRMTRVDLFNGNKREFPLLVTIDDEYAYSVMEKEDLAATPRLLLDKAENTDSIMDAIEDESLIVLKYKIRE